MPTVLAVAVPLPLPAFDFLPPHRASDAITGDATSLPTLGSRLVVPWQLGVRIGVVVGQHERRDSLNLRAAVAVLDEDFLQAQTVTWLKQVAHYSASPLGSVLRDFVPWGLQHPLSHQVRAYPGITQRDIPSDWTDVDTLEPQAVNLWREQGVLEERVQPERAMVQQLIPAKGQAALSEKQRHAWQVLQDVGSSDAMASLARAAQVSSSVVRALVSKGYARYSAVPKPLAALPHIPVSSTPCPSAVPPFVLDIGGNQPQPLHLEGGRRASRLASLLPLLHNQLAAGNSVLILCPEHAYLEETASQLLAWLAPEQAAQLHVFSSDLNEAQREHLWQQARRPCVWLCSYLGMLAPLASLGAVVVLEAASHSYKLLKGSRLFIPTGATMLAQCHGCPCIMSDAVAPLAAQARPNHQLATPALRLHLATLAGSSSYPLASDSIRVLKQVAERKRQALIIASRRGFSAVLRCADCGWMPWCPHCDLPLRYHQHQRLGLRCHQCGYQHAVPSLCENCQGDKIEPSRSAGTQWLVNRVRAMVPELPVYRFDTDHEDDLTPLYAGEPGVMVGTTKLARVSPLPNLSLIVHSLIDSLTSLPEFRAEENAWRFLHQLIEFVPVHSQQRPLIVLQSLQAEQPLVDAFMQQRDIVPEILARRQRFGYPPFQHLVKVQLSAKQLPVLEQTAAWLASALLTAGLDPERLLGPVPAAVARVRGQHSMHILLRLDDAEHAQTWLEPVHNYRGSVRIHIDVEPLEVGSTLQDL